MITANRLRERKDAEREGRQLPRRLPETVSRLAHEAEVRELRRANHAETKALRARIAELEAELDQLTAPGEKKDAPKAPDAKAASPAPGADERASEKGSAKKASAKR